MEFNDEICFIYDRNKLYGILNIGDMIRYYTNGWEKVKITRNFISINEYDFGQAKKVFDRIVTICEVPVVKDGILQGIIKKKKEESTWKKVRELLHNEYLGMSIWKKDELESMIKRIDARVLLYELTPIHVKNMKLSDEQLQLYKTKAKRSCGITNFRMMSEAERRDFWGEEYTEKEFEEFCEDFQKLQKKVVNGVYKRFDLVSKHFNYKDGNRIVPNVNRAATKKIFLVGPCIVGGAYVSDYKTIAFYLQKLLNINEWEDYCVINSGMFGSGYEVGTVLAENLSKDDIVIIMHNYKNEFMQKEIGKCYGKLEDIYAEVDNPINNIFNSLLHCNHVINEKIAQKIFCDIQPYMNKGVSCAVGKKQQDYYIGWEVVKYYRESYIKYGENEKKGKVGGIVMNCNPFTRGHRYLIDQAANKVELLYIFVVEEDKSEFRFEDRIEMVRRGTDDLKNVRVLPSGKFIISKETFSQYFEKTQVEFIEDMDYDVRIFGEVVAREFGISVRFVGEEPFDKVTSKYNKTMQRILPEYGIEVIEIPRKETELGNIISASAVRRAMKEGDAKTIDSMLPTSTKEFLLGNYM